MEEFAARLRAAATRAGMSQTDIARRLKVRPQSVQKWWSAKAEPRGKRIDTLATALGVSKEFLMGLAPDFDEPTLSTPSNRPRNNHTSAPPSGSPIAQMAQATAAIREARDTLKRAAYRLRLDCVDTIVENLERIGIPFFADEDDPFLLTVYPPGEDTITLDTVTPWYTATADGYRIEVHPTEGSKTWKAVPLPPPHSVLFVPADPPAVVLTIRWAPNKLTLFGSDITDLVDCYDIQRLRTRWTEIAAVLSSRGSRDPEETDVHPDN